MTTRYYSIEHRAMVARIPVHTTQEELLINRFDTTDVVIPYHSFIICAWYSYNNECDDHFSFAIYQSDALKETRTFHDKGKLDCDDPVSLVYLRHREFSDIGDAVSEAITRTQLIYADILMNHFHD